MNELELLNQIYARSTSFPPPVEVGPGDDTAVIDISGRKLLLTVDQLIGGRHFDPEQTSVSAIAHKAMGRSVSDIAAMGGTPLVSLVTGALPDGFEGGSALFHALAERGRVWGCPLVGGDIASSDGALSLTATVIGEAHGERGPVLRSGARVGDGVYVTGAIGGSLASGRHLSFEPRVKEGAWLCDRLGDRLGAMIDLSDGLGLDGGRVAQASGAQIVMESALIPMHDGAGAWRSACADGEDYELLFTASGDVPDACDETGVRITRIGEVRSGAGCFVVDDDGALVDVSTLGWSHGSP